MTAPGFTPHDWLAALTVSLGHVAFVAVRLWHAAQRQSAKGVCA